jgi:thioredoxin reductase
MITIDNFEVIIIGGSYSGLAAAMALGRALSQVLVIDSGEPCNRQTPHSHNFLTQDGTPPAEITAIAKTQVEKYDSVQFLNGFVISAVKTEDGFAVGVAGGEVFHAKKLVFATGIRDLLPDIPGFAECWGISVLHCPYCHGYEVRHEKTAVLANGTAGFEFAKLLSNWTDDLTIFTNGPASFTAEEADQLKAHHIDIVELAIERLDHTDGYLQHIVFKDGNEFPVHVLYSRRPFEQHNLLPQELGCELTKEGYIQVNAMQETTIKGVYACGDNTNTMRTVASAVAAGTITGIAISKEFIAEKFQS